MIIMDLKNYVMYQKQTNYIFINIKMKKNNLKMDIILKMKINLT